MSDEREDGGFTLLELLCVMAMLAIMAAIVLPMTPRTTSRARLEAYALQTATLLKIDRNAALRRHSVVTTQVDAPSRRVQSGATGRILDMPRDVIVETVLAARCSGHLAVSSIWFNPTGTSWGGIIALTRAGVGYQVRVNWLTGGIDVVPLDQI
jgi:general secretion pathway protein H